MESIMQSYQVYSARELRNLSGEVIQQAEHGNLGLITKHGKPVMLTIPFNEALLSLGVHRSMAASLFSTGELTLSQAAKLANMPLEAFIQLLGDVGIDAVDYSPDDLKEELEHAL
jgi:prevent-host-death family protein